MSRIYIEINIPISSKLTLFIRVSFNEIVYKFKYILLDRELTLKDLFLKESYFQIWNAPYGSFPEIFR